MTAPSASEAAAGSASTHATYPFHRPEDGEDEGGDISSYISIILHDEKHNTEDEITSLQLRHRSHRDDDDEAEADIAQGTCRQR